MTYALNTKWPHAGGSTATSPPAGDYEVADAFLETYYGDAMRVVTVIAPELDPKIKPKPRSKRFRPDQRDAMRRYLIKENLAGNNIYFPVGELSPSGQTKPKAAREDVMKITHLHADIDAPVDLNWNLPLAVADWKERTLARLQAYPLPPTFLNWSGGGYQAFWRLAEPVIVNGDRALMEPVEDRVKRLLHGLGGDVGTFNSDRIMRVPGTINWPGWKKQKVGRATALSAKIEWDVARVYQLAEFPSWEQSMEVARPKGKRADRNSATPGADAATTNPTTPAPAGQALGHGRPAIVEGNLDSSLLQLVRESVTGLNDPDRSAVFWRVVGDLKGLGFWPGQIIRLLAKYPNGIGERYIAEGRLREQVEKAWHGVEEPTPVEDNEDREPEPIDLWAARIVPAFPLNALPDILRRFVEVNAEASGFDPAALAMSALTTLSAAIDQRTKLLMLEGSDHWVRPILWALLIGDPGSAKTPIMRKAAAPLQQHAMKLKRAYKAELVERSKQETSTDLGATQKKAPHKGGYDDLPEPPEFVAQDVTPERLGVMLAKDKRGILIFRDEVAGWIGGLGRYSSGKMDAARGDVLQLNDGGEWTVRRMGRDDVDVENFSASVLGGVQPDKLATIAGSLQEDGLLQRFLPVSVKNAERARRGVDVGIVNEAYADLVTRLTTVRPAMLVMTREGFDEMERLINRRFDLSIAVSEMGTGLHATINKLDKALGALTIILHMTADRDPDDPFLGFNIEGGYDRVQPETVVAAGRIVFDFLVPNIMALYDGGSRETNEVRTIGGYILTAGKSRILPSDLTSNVASLRGLQAFDVSRKVSTLITYGWLTPEGREPVPKAWRVNPRVRPMFEARRQQLELAKRELARLMGSPRKPHGDPETSLGASKETTDE